MIAAEQKARTTYDNLLRLVKDPDVADPLRFLRMREVVHFQEVRGHADVCKVDGVFHVWEFLYHESGI